MRSESLEMDLSAQRGSRTEEQLMYAIGIDSGTQGTKALLVDFKGRVRGHGYSPHRMAEGLRPGESEQEPGIWVEAMERALGWALRGARVNPREVVCLGVSGQQHGFVPLGENGRPIRPAKLWNDTSTVEEAEMIVRRLGGRKKFIRKLGLSLAVGYTASKILWLKRREPRQYARLKTVLLPHNYLNFYLTGTAAMEYGDASGTGLMDIRNRVWHKEAVAAIHPGLRLKLPPLRHPSEPVGLIKRGIAARFGLERVLVAGGGGDNMMAAIGTGNVVPGVCTASLGTSGTVFSHFRKPFIDPEGEIAAFCDSTGGWLPLLCTMNVTNVTEQFKGLFGLKNKDLEALACRAPAGSEGLLFLPFIDGERVPVLPNSSGVLFGLNRRTFSAPYLARAVIEGTILNLGYGFARMRALGLRPAEIRATGGGAGSRLWLQILADVFQTPVVTLAEQEAAAYGAALQSIWAYELERGRDADITDIIAERVKKASRPIEPRPGNAALYRRLQDRFNSLWRSLGGEFKAHRAATSG
jgi:xylulokinase